MSVGSADFGVISGFGCAQRLSPRTRELAARALGGEFGRTMQKADFALEGAEGLSPNLRYAKAIVAIAEKAPLRVDREEQIIGSATLLEATNHMTPLTDIGSTSHTTLGFERVLTHGYRAIREQIAQRLAREGLDAKGQELLEAMQQCLDGAGVWHARHMALLRERIETSAGRDREHYQEILANLANVPENPATTFREAIQSLWFAYAFQRLCGNWSGIGRIDQMLWPYLEQDLKAGRLTLDEARELVAHFWIKGCEWIGAGHWGSGDAQFYQNIVLSGVDADGNEITNELTYLVLDVVEELHISDFPIAVRVSERTPERLWRRIAEVQRRGGGIVAIYNDDLIIRALTRFGYDLREARCFANDGCWETIIPGRTTFIYCPFDTLQLLQDAVGLNGKAAPEFASFEQVYAAFRAKLEAYLEGFHRSADHAHENGGPTPLVSLLVDDCIERGRAYSDRGAVYTVYAPHAGGLPDTANSLLAIQKLVYERNRFTLQELLDLVRNDWKGAGAESLRQRIRQELILYGNDNAEADAMMKRVYDDYTEIAGRVKNRNGCLRPPGISTFGREIEWRPRRQATAFGRHQGEILATNLAPTPGSDTEGPTAVINSFCAMDFEKLPNGVPLELKLLPTSVRGEAGLQAIVSLMKVFVAKGGVFLHIDVVDSQLLRDAQAHPERYSNLAVRISGWSARFATLSREWQEMVINRTQQTVR